MSDSGPGYSPKDFEMAVAWAEENVPPTNAAIARLIALVRAEGFVLGLEAPRIDDPRPGDGRPADSACECTTWPCPCACHGPGPRTAKAAPCEMCEEYAEEERFLREAYETLRADYARLSEQCPVGAHAEPGRGPEVAVRDVYGDGGTWRLFINGFGVATWPALAPGGVRAYAEEVARCVRRALESRPETALPEPKHATVRWFEALPPEDRRRVTERLVMLWQAARIYVLGQSKDVWRLTDAVEDLETEESLEKGEEPK